VNEAELRVRIWKANSKEGEQKFYSIHVGAASTTFMMSINYLTSSRRRTQYPQMITCVTISGLILMSTIPRMEKIVIIHQEAKKEKSASLSSLLQYLLISKFCHNDIPTLYLLHFSLSHLLLW
jgi:hypothetical protein